MSIQLTQAEIERFKSKLQRTESGCLEWQGETNNRGYGRFTIYRNGGRVRLLTHRLSYSFVHALSDTEKLRHRCDNPPCCDPDHLLPGTQAQNVQDTIERGRINLTGLHAYRAARDQAALARLATGLKVCTWCHVEKSLTDFPRNRGCVDGRGYYCSACMAARRRNVAIAHAAWMAKKKAEKPA